MTEAAPVLARPIHEWQRRVQAEYRSAAVTAQLVHWMVTVGLSEERVAVGLRIVGDELAHARLSQDCVIALGGDDEPQPMHAGTLAEPADEGVLAGLTDSLLSNFLFGETLAVPLFRALRAHASHPAVDPVLTRILRDEAVHRAFGWDTLDELLELFPAVADRVAARLPMVYERFRDSYAAEGADVVLSDEEEAAGLMRASVYREVFYATVPDLQRRFAKRAIPWPASASSAHEPPTP